MAKQSRIVTILELMAAGELPSDLVSTSRRIEARLMRDDT